MTEKRMGVSPITNTIYYGNVNIEKQTWTGNKTDVTDMAIAAVFEWFMGNMDGNDEYSITFPGCEYRLTMDRKVGNNNDEKNR